MAIFVEFSCLCVSSRKQHYNNIFFKVKRRQGHWPASPMLVMFWHACFTRFRFKSAIIQRELKFTQRINHVENNAIAIKNWRRDKLGIQFEKWLCSTPCILSLGIERKVFIGWIPWSICFSCMLRERIELKV
jgi:hypothetical protein